MRHLIASLGCLLVAGSPARAADTFYYRNVTPSLPSSVGNGAGGAPGTGANDAPATAAPLAAGYTGTVANVSVGDASTIRFGATGGRAPYTFSSPDAPPSGLTLSADGTLGGTFGYAGSYAMTVTAKDAANATKTVTLTLDVRPPAPAVALAQPINGGKALVAGFPFTAQATESSGGMLTWSVPAQPFAIGVDGSGLVSGTIPQGTSGFGFTVRGTDVFNRSADAASGALAVQQPSLTASVPSVAVQEGSFAGFSVATNLPSPTYSLAGGPAGSGVNTGGVVDIYGANVEADTNSTVTVTAKSGSVTLTTDVPVTVQAATAAMDPIPDLRAGQVVTTQIRTTMNHPGQWSVSSNPADVGLSGPPATTTAPLQVTAPANPGTTPLSRTITALYGAYNAPSAAPQATASASRTVSVYPALAFASAPAPLNGVPGTAVSRGAPGVNGQAGALTYKLFSGATEIPAGTVGSCTGLSFATSGVIAGTPTKACSLPSLTLRVADAGVGTLAATTADSAAFALTIASTMSLGTQPSSTLVNQGSTASTGAAVSGTPYGATAWDVLDENNAVATLPAWITKASGTCAASNAGCSLQAAPTLSTTPGTYPATGGYKIRVTDASGTTVTSAAFAFTVKQTPVSASITTTTYAAVVGGPVTTAAVTTAGGSTPYAYTANGQSGTAPAAAGTFAANGAYTFTPDSATVGTWVFKIRATSAGDATNYADTAAINVNVAALSVNAISAQTAYTSRSYSLQAQTNSTGSATWTATGLPAGLGISTAGLITGTTTAANGTYPVTVTASLAGATASKSFNVTVSPPPAASWANFQSALTAAGWTIQSQLCVPCGYKATYAQFMALSNNAPYNTPVGWGAAYNGGNFGGVYANPPMKDTRNVMNGIADAQNTFGPSTNSTATVGGDFSTTVSGTVYQMIFMDYSNTTGNNQYAITIRKN